MKGLTDINKTIYVAESSVFHPETASQTVFNREGKGNRNENLLRLLAFIQMVFAQKELEVSECRIFSSSPSSQLDAMPPSPFLHKAPF